MKLPIELVHRIQYDFAAEKYKAGTQVFNTVDEETVKIVIKSVLEWSKEMGYVNDNKLEFSNFIID